MNTCLYYVYDPMCSWCWGYRPVWMTIRQTLSDRLPVVNLLGGLAADTDQPMPPAMCEAIQGHWRRIAALLGTRFNFDFWHLCQPRRATYPACRAVLSAAAQGQEENMIQAIQEAYYLHARNPSDTATLVQLATEIGLDRARFQRDLESAQTEQELQRQIARARGLGVHGFPSLVLDQDGRTQPIEVDYHDPANTLARIDASLSPTQSAAH